jgi:hypothetical protein
MPLERCNAVLDLSDATIILGPCKCCPTECVLENGDPLASKKKRRDNVSTSDAGVTASNITNLCVDNGKDTVHTLSLILPLPSQLAHTLLYATQRDTVNHAQHNDTDTANTIIVEDKGAITEEDDEAELGQYSITLVYFC